MKTFLIIAFCFLLGACGTDPKDTLIPQDIENIDSLAPVIEKLTSEERALLAAYVMRHTLRSTLKKAFGMNAASDIPAGMTVGRAIEIERNFNTEREAKEKQRLAQIELAMKPLKDAASFALKSKAYGNEVIRNPFTHEEHIMDEFIRFKFLLTNNESKSISGIKGHVLFLDVFGDKITRFNVSSDKTIKPGGSTGHEVRLSLLYSENEAKLRSLPQMEENKFSMIWEPSMIIFSDGSKLQAPPR